MLTLFEHQTVPFTWSKPQLAALARLNQAQGDTLLRPVLGKNGGSALQSTQYVGVVRLGRETIQILPKIYRHEECGPEEAARNLLHLLAVAADLPLREQALAPLLRRRADWFEILTGLFAAHLTDAWQRGIVRGYVACEDDASPFLRGQWRQATQMRRPERRHRFCVTYDEFTPDNPLNRVLRFVVERLWTLTRDVDNRRALATLRAWMDEVTLLPAVSAAEATSVSLTRLHPSYAPLLTLARLFLDGGSLQLSGGSHESFAFVFDMNRLFESFVFGFLRRHRAALLPSSLADCTLLPQSTGAHRHLARHDGHPVFCLKPDLAFRAPDGAFPLLLDTKYKSLSPAERRPAGIAPSDMYQMHAYARRYACPRVLLLYPQTAGMTDPLRLSFDLEGGGTVSAATLDLRVELGKREGVGQLIEEMKTILEDMDQ
jgi:5-methylcytosine-specific restriction enzyme subunit McrC